MILENYDLRSLILQAYGLPMYRFSGPEWLFDIRFDVSATMPPETTKDQFQAMQRDMLARRFGLVAHHENKDLPIYELVVAKGGSKLRDAAPPQEAPAEDSRVNMADVRRDENGFPILTDPRMTMMATGDRMAYRQLGATAEQLATFLGNQMQAPVKDATGLTGKYDISLKWVPAQRSTEGLLPSLEEALPLQLGLTLRKAKGPVDVLVMDHIEKMPTEN